MIWLEIIILAIVQGIAEFLPISSSGHVVVGAAVCDQLGHPISEKLMVNIVLHLGTLLSILVFYCRRIRLLLGEDRRVIGLLVVGSVPAAIVGVLIKGTGYGDVIEGALESALLAGFMLPLTGAMLIWTAPRQTGQITCRQLGYGQALLVGAFQAFAILPGISRSGATIVAGLGCGMRRDEAATFSFLLAIPAIGGAGLLELKDLLGGAAGAVPPGALALGCLLSFLIGLLSLCWLIRWLQQGRLHLFAWWVIPLGLAVVAWQLLGLC
jgi:undecaprenyl-diphosphatase